MFITRKRHEREKQELIGASNRITEAILRHSEQGLFLLDARNRILPQVSQSLSSLFRRDDFNNLTFDKLLAPLVTAKVLTQARNYIAHLLGTAPPRDDGGIVSTEPPQPQASPLSDVEIRLPNSDGSFDSAHYAFEFDPIGAAGEQRTWLVRVSDITARMQAARELEELRAQVQTQSEILRSVLKSGGARFAALLHRTDGAMKTINTVLKKPAREQDAFRQKLEETLEEVDRIRRDAAAFHLGALEGSARQFEDALHDLRSRPALSGSDFLPLAVKLDHLYGQFALLKSLSAVTAGARAADPASKAAPKTATGTQIIEAPKFMARSKSAAVPGAQLSAPAGSLENTLRALCDHVAQEHDKTVTLEALGLVLVPPAYQSAIKNIAIQLIRNAVMHGIETPVQRDAAGKTPLGTMRLEFKSGPDGSYELLFEDDGCGLDPDKVRATAIARGIITGEGAARMRDREAIKLIFKSGYSTLPSSPGEPAHGTGLALVRRYVHEAGGKVALASLLGHETRFKVTLPPLVEASASSSSAA
ncbi:MAG TPA: ATP-binding protein [Steroidobacteraceae bacterium]|nr:ATP-binding protein [Steroidobacteraceae bacterium]